ncbi:hypothetical protein [Streptomyces sp. NPDC058045]|uniref:hypothetical protein n=1 Tax=Streptomyces sp. NPDC058045 TaxID=3346311 RepID=UPI0036EBCA9B
MTAVIAAMLTAVAGVLGTLFAPLVSQRAAARERAEQRTESELQRRHEERRASYIAVNRSARQFNTLLKDALHRLRDGVYGEQERTALEAARLEYRDCYAESQMVVPARILDAIRAANRVLAPVDGAVKRLDRGLARPEDTPGDLIARLTSEADPLLATLRRLMREDLGVSD